MHLQFPLPLTFLGCAGIQCRLPTSAILSLPPNSHLALINTYSCVTSVASVLRWFQTDWISTGNRPVNFHRFRIACYWIISTHPTSAFIPHCFIHRILAFLHDDANNELANFGTVFDSQCTMYNVLCMRNLRYNKFIVNIGSLFVQATFLRRLCSNSNFVIGLSSRGVVGQGVRGTEPQMTSKIFTNLKPWFQRRQRLSNIG